MRIPPYPNLLNPWPYRVLVRLGLVHSPSICMRDAFRNGIGCPYHVRKYRG